MGQIQGFLLRHTFPFLVYTALFIGVTPSVSGGDSRGLKSSSVTASYHYEPVPGKLVGIWPDQWTTSRMSEFRLQYGFSGVFLGDPISQYQSALDAGFSPPSLMILVESDNFTPIVDACYGGFYYVDEPVEHSCTGAPTAGRFKSLADLDARHNYISSTRPSAQFVISGYKRCSHNVLASGHADLMMYSSYANWDNFGLPVCAVSLGFGDYLETAWIPGSSDQSGSWADMKRVFGGKFSMTWLNGGGDEYDPLLVTATSLGLQAVWLYNGGPVDSARLESFCQAAVAHGWLSKVDGAPLPVQLASFHAYPQSGSSVELQWRTIT
jgi:hypothetical protein